MAKLIVKRKHKLLDTVYFLDKNQCMVETYVVSCMTHLMEEYYLLAGEGGRVAGSNVFTYDQVKARKIN